MKKNNFKKDIFIKKISKRTFLIALVLFFTIININYSYSTTANDDNSYGNVNNIINDNNSNNSNSISLSATSSILIDKNTSKILYENNSNQKMYPASTTKLLTAILITEKYKDLSLPVNISYYAVEAVPYSYSTANLEPDDSVSLKDLLDALLIASANDAAYSLAEYIANDGNNYSTDSSENSKNRFYESISKFSNLMNAKAKELGCQNSNFVNPNGIHNENHYSTAYDLALIGSYAYNNSTIQSIVSKTSFSFNNTSFNTTNLLLHKERNTYYKYANGLKTGYTDPAQYCMIASAKKDDRVLIAVVLHSEENLREEDLKKLFEYGFNEYTYADLIKENEIVRSIYVINATPKTNKLNAICETNLKALIKKGEVIDITPTIELQNHFAPISQGEIIGKITYEVDGITYSSNLIADHDVYSSNYMNIIILISSIFIMLLISFLIINKKTRIKPKATNK